MGGSLQQIHSMERSKICFSF